MEGQETRPRETPATDAAGLLVRIGFGILVLIAPFAALFSRRSFVVLVPVGALLIAVAALVNDGGLYMRRLKEALLSPIGVVALLFGLWVLLSLAWTPFPGAAAERALRMFGNVALATAVCAALPDRMRSSNLNLMSLGIAAATVTLVAVTIVGSLSTRFLANPEAPTLPRAAIAAGILVWPALAWTITRGRDLEGLLLIAACGVAALASGSGAAAVVLFTALFVFLAARANASATGKALAAFWAGVVMLAPLAAPAARFLAEASQLSASHIFSQIGYWAGIIAQQPVRLLTGHGSDTLNRAKAAGLIDPQAPSGMLVEVWYDLGLPGALGVACALYLALRALALLPVHVAAAALAVVSSVITFLIIDSTATQQWWLSIVSVAAITMMAVLHGQHRTRRPAASVRTRRIGISTGR